MNSPAGYDLQMNNIGYYLAAYSYLFENSGIHVGTALRGDKPWRFHFGAVRSPDILGHVEIFIITTPPKG